MKSDVHKFIFFYILYRKTIYLQILFLLFEKMK